MVQSHAMSIFGYQIDHYAIIRGNTVIHTGWIIAATEEEARTGMWGTVLRTYRHGKEIRYYTQDTLFVLAPMWTGTCMHLGKDKAQPFEWIENGKPE